MKSYALDCGKDKSYALPAHLIERDMCLEVGRSKLNLRSWTHFTGFVTLVNPKTNGCITLEFRNEVLYGRRRKVVYRSYSREGGHKKDFMFGQVKNGEVVPFSNIKSDHKAYKYVKLLNAAVSYFKPPVDCFVEAYCGETGFALTNARSVLRGYGPSVQEIRRAA